MEPKSEKVYELRDVNMAYNLDSRSHIIYGTLVDSEGHLVISATLNYILAAIAERHYKVRGVEVQERRLTKGKNAGKTYKLITLSVKE